jgi:hypothetical protein
MDLSDSDKEYYKHRYGSDVPNLQDPTPEPINFTFPNIEELNPSQLVYLKSMCEKCLEDINLVMKASDISKAKENIKGMEYLLYWFDIWVETITTKSPSDDDDADVIDILRKWFVKYADPKMFEYTEGSYVDKRSTYMTVHYTLWLKIQDLYCHRYEGDRNWRYQRIWSQETKTYIHSDEDSPYLSEILHPMSEEDIFKKFELVDKECANPVFMEEFTKFIHCKVLDDRDHEWDERPYVHLNEHCSEFDY